MKVAALGVLGKRVLNSLERFCVLYLPRHRSYVCTKVSRLVGMASSFSWQGARQGSRKFFSDGIGRVRDDFFQSLQIVVAGVGAYAFAEKVLGHHEPIFAATAAIVSLGFVRGSTHARRILEVSIGVTLGILIGDSLMLLLGRGLWQAALVLLISVLVARFLDRGILFTIQMGLQSCLVVLMHPNVDGTFARSLDGVIGGLFAFLMMFVFPKDPRRTPRQNLLNLVESFAASLRSSATAIEHYDATEAWHSLITARKLQPLYTAASGDLVTAKGMAKLSALGKNHATELEEFSATLTAIDLAVRNTRVFDRRMASTIRHVQLSDSAIHSLSEVLNKIADGVTVLGQAVGMAKADERHAVKEQAREIFTQVAGTVEPSMMGVRSQEGEALVLMLRPLVVDLLEATGMSHQKGVDLLVPLGESITEHAPKTSRVPLVTDGRCTDDSDYEKSKADTRALNIILRTKPINAQKKAEN